MKWSEQMRVLLSEDEHYNQLMLDTVSGELFINGEFIEVLPRSEEGRTIEDFKFKEIIKKYPFFDDIKFLLNCIFKLNTGDFIAYEKTDSVIKYNDHYQIYCENNPTKLIIYFTKQEISQKNRGIIPLFLLCGKCGQIVGIECAAKM